ncbi:MAG: hypothetical protein LBO04_02905 [Spirochaetaceae bacterium]|nr:hypothetical protein [Spirochaetaceae bacterium]
MCKIRVLPAFFILGALFSGCGDLDLALSSGKAYKVNALINGLSLDECAILSKESRISPYFDFNARGDPDIASLVIYFKDYMGKEAGTRMRYNFSIQDKVDTDTDTLETDSGAKGDGWVDEPSGETTGGGTASTTEDAAASSAGDVSYEVPADSGTLSTVPADSGTVSVIESETESVPAENSAPDSFENIIVVKNLDDELPALSPGANMTLGFYSIVFEVIASSGTLLNSVERPFFYLADRKLTVDGIVSYIPGVSSSSGIVPPGEKIMLQANISASGDIDPYVIWYNGKQHIGEGLVREGAYRIFWNAPAQTGFQDIRVEVFPFNPALSIPAIRGISHTVSLPVSSRHGRNGYYGDREVQMSRWYRLWGNLTDAKDPVSIGALLTGADERDPVWLPVFNTYGLALGANDAYKFPDSLFKYVKPNEGSAEIMFRFAPSGNTAVEKPLLLADLPGEDTEGNETQCKIRLYLFENSLILEAAVNDEILEARPLLMFDGGGFVQTAIDFQFFDEHIVVSIGLENVKTHCIDTWERLTVDFIPNGEGRVRFGGFFETENPADTVSAVITEIALFYNEISPALEPAEDEDAEKDPEEKVPETPPEKLLPKNDT